MNDNNESFPPVGWINKGLDLSNKADYLLYNLFRYIGVVGLVLFILIHADAFLEFGWFFNSQIDPLENFVLTKTFIDIYTFSAFLLMIIFYIKIRVSVVISRDHIPMMLRKKTFLNTSRKRALSMMAFLISMLIIGIACMDILIQRALLHYEMANDAVLISIMDVMAIIAISCISPIIVSAVLCFEKAARNYDYFLKDLQESGADHFLDK